MSARRGQALVEFALVLPIMLTLMLSVIEGGRLIFTWVMLAEASREAARTATLPNKICTDVVDKSAMNLGNVVGATTSEVEVQLEPSGSTTWGSYSSSKQRGDTVSVKIDHPFTLTAVPFAVGSITVQTEMWVES